MEVALPSSADWAVLPSFTSPVEIIASMEAGFQCAGCGEWNTTAVDESAGSRQRYVEDCQICCKPNLLLVEYDTSAQEFFITAALE